MSTTAKCPYCPKRFIYAKRFYSHIIDIHPFAAQVLLAKENLPAGEDSQQEGLQGLLYSDDYIHNADDDFESYPLDSIIENSDEESEVDYQEAGDARLREPSTTVYEGAGSPIGVTEGFHEAGIALLNNPWVPFKSMEEFNLARWFIRSRASQRDVDNYFKDSLGPRDCSFSSGKTLVSKLEQIHTLLGRPSWHHSSVDFGGSSVPYFYRNPITCIRYLLGQRVYKDDMVYAPVIEENERGERMYSEIHTAEWWWETQKTLPDGSTVIPVICASDSTQLTSFSGDKKAWPVYITIGNIKSATRNKPSSVAIILLALLPVPPKLSKESAASRIQRRQSQAALHKILEEVLEGLQGPAVSGEVFDCSDGYQRLCFPILCGWIADQEEHATLHNIRSNACPHCEVDFESLGDLRSFPQRDIKQYKENVEHFQRTGDKASIEYLVKKSLKALGGAFWTLPNVDPANLHKPDLLHNIYLGLFKHLMEWVMGFLEKHNRVTRFDEVWRSMPPYPGFSVPNKRYREVTQWQGKEMRNLSKIILGAFAVALKNPSNALRAEFREALKCVRSLIDFSLMAQYKTHTDTTLGYMSNFLKDFHSSKGVFLEFRISKTTRKSVKARTKALIASTIEDPAPAIGKTSAKGKKRSLQQQGSRSPFEELEEMKSASHFNFIKMHLLTHYTHCVSRFGSIPQWSTDVSELAHRDQIKDSYNSSNKVDASTQIIDIYSRRQAVYAWVLNLKACLKSYGDNGEGYENLREMVLIDEGKKCADTNSRYFTAPPTDPSRRKLCGGGRKRTYTLENVSKDLKLPNLAKGIWKYGKGLEGSCQILGNIESLLSYPTESFPRLKVPVAVFQEVDTYEWHNLRCTGSQTFRNRASRNDFIWVQVQEASSQAYGALGGRLPGRLRALLKFRDPVAEFTHRLALVQMLRVTNGGRIENGHGLIKVSTRLPTEQGDEWIVDIRTITGMAHLIPASDDHWLVNNRIDLKTWNEMY